MSDTKVTMQDLRDAYKSGWAITDKDRMFFLRQRSNGDCHGPTVILKRGTKVKVEKIYRRGRAALLQYTDRSGKVWRSWTHATEFEPVRKYEKRDLD